MATAAVHVLALVAVHLAQTADKSEYPSLHVAGAFEALQVLTAPPKPVHFLQSGNGPT